MTAPPMPSSSTVPISSASPSARLEMDLPCRRCGYNLRAGSVQGNCPECGWPVQRTLHWQNWRSAGRPALNRAFLAWSLWLLSLAWFSLFELAGTWELLGGWLPISGFWRTLESLYRPLLIMSMGVAAWLLWPAFERTIPVFWFRCLGSLTRSLAFFLAGLQLAWTFQGQTTWIPQRLLDDISFGSLLILILSLSLATACPLPALDWASSRPWRRWGLALAVSLGPLAAGLLVQVSLAERCFNAWPLGYELLFRWLPFWLTWLILGLYLDQIFRAVCPLNRFRGRIFRFYVWTLPILMIAFELVPLLFYWTLNSLPDWRFMRLVRQPLVREFWWLWEAAARMGAALLHVLALVVCWPLLNTLYRTWRQAPAPHPSPSAPLQPSVKPENP